MPIARLFILTACMAVSAAHADDYSDVSQLLNQGKLAEAQARVERYLAVKPRDAQMRLFKGVIQRESGRPSEALATFTKLTEDYPELPEPYNNLAVVLAAQGQYDKARVALEKALHTNPSYATAHDNLGDIYARLASQAYSKALQLDGASPSEPVRLTLLRNLSNAPGTPPRQVLAAAKPAPAEAAPKPTPAPKPAAAPTAVAPPPPAKPAAVAAAPATAKPTTAAPAPTPVPAATPANSNREVEQAVRAWARAWSEKNMTQYLAAYSRDFQTPGGISRATWEQERRLRITSKSRIAVNLTELQITVNGTHAVAKFRQDYKADALAVMSRKTLELGRTGDRWLITKEASGG